MLSINMFTLEKVLEFGVKVYSCNNWCFWRWIFEITYEDDTTRLLRTHKPNGFPSMLRFSDCMHCAWNNDPLELQDQYKGPTWRSPLLFYRILIASNDLSIWHAFFSFPESCNDIIVLHRSCLFAKLTESIAPQVNYIVNGHNYTMSYYLLGDGLLLWGIGNIFPK